MKKPNCPSRCCRKCGEHLCTRNYLKMCKKCFLSLPVAQRKQLSEAKKIILKLRS